jgi:hypothetical protein
VRIAKIKESTESVIAGNTGEHSHCGNFANTDDHHSGCGNVLVEDRPTKYKERGRARSKSPHWPVEYRFGADLGLTQPEMLRES